MIITQFIKNVEIKKNVQSKAAKIFKREFIIMSKIGQRDQNMECKTT